MATRSLEPGRDRCSRDRSLDLPGSEVWRQGLESRSRLLLREHMPTVVPGPPRLLEFACSWGAPQAGTMIGMT